MRCEGGVAPGFFRSLYAPIERASGGVAVQASSAAAVTRSRSESSSMLHSPSLTFSHWLKRLLKNLVVSWSGWDSEGIRKDKDESPGVGVKATKPQSCRAKVSGNSLKQIIGPRHPLFWGSNTQQSAH